MHKDSRVVSELAARQEKVESPKEEEKPPTPLSVSANPDYVNVPGVKAVLGGPQLPGRVLPDRIAGTTYLVQTARAHSLWSVLGYFSEWSYRTGLL
jgi:hypothetical protein